MSAVKTPDEYVQGFPHKRLPTIDVEPTYITIKEAHKCLSANASTIKTTLGGGRHVEWYYVSILTQHISQKQVPAHVLEVTSS